MSALRLLHISDLHIGDESLRGGRKYLELAHGKLNVLLGPPAMNADRNFLKTALEERAGWADWVIVTGDLSHTGRSSDLSEAAMYIDALEGGFSNRTGRARRSFMLLPGNHDRYTEDGPYPSGVMPLAFDAKFSSYWNVGRGVDFRTLSNDLRVKAGFADFSLREEEAGSIRRVLSEFSGEEIVRFCGMCGQGRVYDDLLDSLYEESARWIMLGWKVIWVVHFAPFPPKLEGHKRQWSLMLRGEDKLVSAAKSLGISQIFCGHTHESDRYNCDGVEVFCSGPALRNRPEKKASFFAVELEVLEEGLRTLSAEVVERVKNSGGYH